MTFPISPSTLAVRLRRAGPTGVLAVTLLPACGSGVDSTAGAAEPNAAAEAGSSSSSSTVSLADGELALYDSEAVHDIEITFDHDAYDAIVDTYAETGEKDWMEATVTIDGRLYEQAGIRLKGNSSLFGLTTETAENPEDLPWLISLDKYVDDQTHHGYTDIVIRSNNSETALNETVALELLDLAGLASQEAISTSFTVNGGESELRLAVESPDDAWDDANFDGPGNNSYLHYDDETQQFTVVNWDLNLTLFPGGQGAGMGGFGREPPEGMPEGGGFGGERPDGAPEGGGFGGDANAVRTAIDGLT